ncbi:hypothetical protein, partial [Vibrio sp. F13]|uniref:hypothetical protein n=1 Tax=Vibrio sp. F13 TaxID=2070777 RepID=UPI0019D319C1
AITEIRTCPKKALNQVSATQINAPDFKTRDDAQPAKHRCQSLLNSYPYLGVLNSTLLAFRYVQTKKAPNQKERGQKQTMNFQM